MHTDARNSTEETPMAEHGEDSVKTIPYAIVDHGICAVIPPPFDDIQCADET
jgi:hypothetical protein